MGTDGLLGGQRESMTVSIKFVTQFLIPALTVSLLE